MVCRPGRCRGGDAGAFFHFLKNFKILIHFNGDGFDIPYLLKRCAACGLDFDFSGVKSVDLYKKIKPFKKILGLENLKQKTIEGFLDIERQDRFSGGQLIEVYHDYLATGMKLSSAFCFSTTRMI